MLNILNYAWPLVKPILFKMDPEAAHNLTLRCLNFVPNRAQILQSKPTTLKFCNVSFRNPVGLAAGMDKNAHCLLGWQNMGFGFAEVGTVTALPQPGNPKPRLFRLVDQGALYNRMGFNNDGAIVIAKRIAQQRKDSNLQIPIGVNIGKSAVVPLENAADDYAASFDSLADIADYIVVNVSSPNTKGLRDLQKKDALAHILDVIGNKNAKRNSQRPILLKIAPDLETEEAINICQNALESGVEGLIISNTTIQSFGLNLPKGGGGLSGKPLFESSTKLLSDIREAVGDKPLIIGSGGVMSAKDAQSKIKSGANLVQLYSGLVYGGPSIVGKCVQAVTSPLPV